MVVPKFRAWVEAEETMHPVLSLDWSGIDDDLTVFVPMGHTSSRAVSIDNAVLMRSTGVFDVNGKEIFEGDVFTYLDDDNNPIYENIVVKFGQHTNMDTIYERGPVYIGLYVEAQKGTATLEIDSMYNDCEGRLTIIGNIYENPELVEVTND
ncbi:YopX family protein [Streptococcus suis]|uniref:YopX family protein n=1 Tax=Streptococcus suis TaxID=1307 RepID=UPI002FCA909F